MGPHKLFRSTLVVSACTAASRLLGFAREIFMAYFFGTTLAKSAFDVAFRIPNLFRRLFGEGALSAAFVPVFSETLKKDGLPEANRLASRMLTLLALTLALLVAAGIVVASMCLSACEPGTRVAEVLALLRIMLPYMFFICLVALCMGILNSFHHFMLPAFTPVLLNIVWIASIFLLAPRFGDTAGERIHGVAWGIVLAGIIQLTIQLPALLKFGIRPRFDLVWHDARVKRVLLLMGPAALGMGITQVNVVLDGVLALIIGPWAPAALTYAERLIYLPLGIFATALGTVLLPTFSHQAADDKHDEILSTMKTALGALLVVMVPASIGLMVLSGEIVDLAFLWEGGEFDSLSSLRTTRALCFYAPGLVVFSIYKVLVPAFYAMKDTRTPVKVGAAMVGLNLTLNIVFILTWPTEFKHAGLAMATVITSAISCLILARLLKKRIGTLAWGRVGVTGLKSLLASLVMAGAAVGMHYLTAQFAESHAVNAKVSQLLSVGCGIAVGMGLYILLIGLLCPTELKKLRRR